tara:strand:- start:410 stop:610 length:201 start_codon:yes stop_codon:yes gene_type:complete
MKIRILVTDETGTLLDKSEMEIESFVTRLEVTPKGGLDLTGSEFVELSVRKTSRFEQLFDLLIRKS